MQVHTFHGAGLGIYGNSNSRTNQGLIEILKERTAPRQALEFDVLVVDEAQDCRPLLFQMAVKLLNDCSASRALSGAPPPQVNPLEITVCVRRAGEVKQPHDTRYARKGYRPRLPHGAPAT